MTRTIGAAAAVLTFAIAGCGSSNNNSSNNNASTTPASTTPTTPASSGSSGASTNLKVSADPSGALKFDKSSLNAKAGSVTITMDNPSSVPHGIGVKGGGVDKDGSVVNQGGKSTVTVSLKKGSYEFYCPVPGHEQAGMKGTLTVK